MLEFNLDVITLEDCITAYEFRHKTVVIEDGHIVRFMEEEE